MQIVIDTHKFVKFLSEEKHFTQKQAEVLIEAATEYHNAYTKELATKQDAEAVKKELQGEIHSLRKDLRGEIDSLRKETKAEFREVRSEINLLRKDMMVLKNDIIVKISGVMFALLITFKMFDKFF